MVGSGSRKSVKQALLDRGVDEKYTVHICEEAQTATFMLHSPSSYALRGFQQYRPFVTEKKTNDPKTSRYFTYQPRVYGPGDPCVFGLDYCDLDNIEHLFITEGLFETVKLLNLGFNSVAILSSNASKILLDELGQMCDIIIWCGDADDAGNKSNIRKIATHRLSFDKDLDEVDDLEITNKIKELLEN